MTDHFDVGISDTPRQVYVLVWRSFEGKGILGVYSDRDKALEDWRKYHKNSLLIDEFIGNTLSDRRVDSDPDDAIEVWDVK